MVSDLSVLSGLRSVLREQSLSVGRIPEFRSSGAACRYLCAADRHTQPIGRFLLIQQLADEGITVLEYPQTILNTNKMGEALFSRVIASALWLFSYLSEGLSRFCRLRLRDLALVSLYGSPTHFSCNGLPQRVWENPLKKRFLRRASACYLRPVAGVAGLREITASQIEKAAHSKYLISEKSFELF